MVVPISDSSMFRGWFRDMVRRDASDLFLFPNEPPALRVRGIIERMGTEALSPARVRQLAEAAFGVSVIQRFAASSYPDDKGAAPISSETYDPITGGTLRGVASIQACDDPEIEETLRNRFGEISPDRPVRFALNLGRTLGDFSITVQLMPWVLFAPERLGIPEAVIATAGCSSGLILLSGIAGSGKTTVAASLIDHINASRQAQICVIGDPLIYLFEPRQCLVQHKEAGIDVPSVLAGIRAAHMQDADVLFVSDLRCPEEIEACLAVAEERLVITQILARSPEDALERLVNAFIPELHGMVRKNLAGVLRGAVCQRLLHRADGKGRVAAYGVLIPNSEMRRMFAHGEGLGNWQGPLPNGCQSIAAHIGRLKADGIISAEEAEKHLADMGEARN